MSTPPADITAPPTARGSSVVRWVLLVILAIAVMEITVRVEERVSYGMPLLSRVEHSGDLVVRDSLGARGRPNTVFRRWRLNNLGFRGPDVALEPGPATLRVVTTGASETFGLYESTGSEYPRQLEDSLRVRLEAVCGSGGTRVEVVNAALPGMALPSLERHLAVVRSLEPDVLLIYPSPGFYLNPFVPRPAIGARGDTALPASKARTLRIQDRIVTQLKTLAPRWAMTKARKLSIERVRNRYPAGWVFDGVPADRLDRFDADLRAVIGTARVAGITPVLVGYVSATMAPGFDDQVMLTAWEYQFPRARAEAIPAFHEQAAQRIARVAADSGVQYIDLRRAFDGHWDGSFADFVHFTNRGAGVVAGALSESIVARLDRSTVCPRAETAGRDR